MQYENEEGAEIDEDRSHSGRTKRKPRPEIPRLLVGNEESMIPAHQQHQRRGMNKTGVESGGEKSSIWPRAGNCGWSGCAHVG